MKIHVRALSCCFLVLALAVSGIGCGGEDTPVAPQNTDPTTRKVTVTVGSVVVIGSCEGSATNPGDFTYELEVSEPGKDKADWLRFSGSFSGLAGQTVDIPDVVFTMDREPKSGDWFELVFHVTEWDGANITDDRMNDSMGTGYHKWTGGDDWMNGAHVVMVSGSAECRVNMVYSVDVK